VLYQAKLNLELISSLSQNHERFCEYWYLKHHGHAGENIYAYIVDTGIYIAHNEFGGRAIYGGNFVELLSLPTIVMDMELTLLVLLVELVTVLLPKST